MLRQIAANVRLILCHASGLFVRRCGYLQFRSAQVALVLVAFHCEDAFEILARHRQQLVGRVGQQCNLVEEKSVCLVAQNEILAHSGQCSASANHDSR